MKELIILGAGENGIMIIDIVNAINRIKPTYKILGFLDDDPEKVHKLFSGFKVLGIMDEWKKYSDVFFTTPLVSSPKKNYLKLMVLNRLNIPISKFVNLIHPSIFIPDSVLMGVGNWIMPGAQIHPNVKLGNHIYISSNCVIGYNSELKDFCNLSMTSIVLGNTIVETGCYIGANCSIFGQRNRIGAWSVIGMGAVVLNEVADYSIVAGNPAKVIGENTNAMEYIMNL